MYPYPQHQILLSKKQIKMSEAFTLHLADAFVQSDVQGRNNNSKKRQAATVCPNTCPGRIVAECPGASLKHDTNNTITTLIITVLQAYNSHLRM